MFEWRDAGSRVGMTEGGLMLLDEDDGLEKSLKAFAVTEWKKAFDHAKEDIRFDGVVYFEIWEH